MNIINDMFYIENKCVLIQAYSSPHFHLSARVTLNLFVIEIYPPCSFVFAPDAAKFLSYCHQMSQSVNLQFYWGKEQFQPVKVVTIRFFYSHPLIVEQKLMQSAT